MAVNGESLGLGGYLDIGLLDTMKDLFVNFIGAVVFLSLDFSMLNPEEKENGQTLYSQTEKERGRLFAHHSGRRKKGRIK